MRLAPLVGFRRRAVRDDGPELHPRGQLLHAADVIRVVVRDHEIVDRADARLLHCRGNALGIAQRVRRPAGIHQHRLTRRRDDERRLAAFDVDEIQPQRLRGRHGRRRQNDARRNHDRADTISFLARPARGGTTTSNLRAASRTMPTTSSSSGAVPVFSNDFVWFS